MSSPPPVDDRTVYLGKDFIWTWYRSGSRMGEATLSISQSRLRYAQYLSTISSHSVLHGAGGLRLACKDLPWVILTFLGILHASHIDQRWNAYFHDDAIGGHKQNGNPKPRVEDPAWVGVHMRKPSIRLVAYLVLICGQQCLSTSLQTPTEQIKHPQALCKPTSPPLPEFKNERTHCGSMPVVEDWLPSYFPYLPQS